MIETLKKDKRNKSVLGIIIRTNRNKQGLTLRALAKMASISHTLISNIENGKQLPSEETLSDLFKALGLKLHDDVSLTDEMDEASKAILTDLMNHHYKKAAGRISILKKKEDSFLHSLEVINYVLISCLFHTLTDTRNTDIDSCIEEYGNVIDFFSETQKQLFDFIVGLNALNKDYYKVASDSFEAALRKGDRKLDVLIKEYLVESYMKQYKFTDSVRIAENVIAEYEDRALYLRAMNTRLSIARVYTTILKHKEAFEQVEYVESFSKQFNLEILMDQCRIIRSEIHFLRKEYKHTLKILRNVKDIQPKYILYPMFRALLMLKHEGLNAYYKMIVDTKQNQISEIGFLIIKVLMLWKNPDMDKDDEYIKSLHKLADLSVEANYQEYVGLTYNLLIMYYRERRKYKKALEIADEFLLNKRIHISYFAVYDS